MKKPSKPAASPAPATAKASKPASKPAAAAKSTTPAPRVKSPTPVKGPANSPTTSLRSAAPAPAPAASGAASFTVIDARIDVGFGNALFVRGDGPGLSWTKGLPLKNDGAEQWTISLPRAARPVVFKLLINDEIWSSGDDYRADPGVAIKISPRFES